ncbi:MAG: 50S ribosomal protein L22 [Fimbriimonadales bacterium]
MKAVAKHVRIPPRKARLAIDLVRGKPVNEAITILQRLPNKSARIARKVLESAVANAMHNDGLSPNMLYIARAYVDEGPRWKRILPKDRGRAYRILKRTSHVTIILGVTVPQPRPTARKASSTAAPQEEQN